MAVSCAFSIMKMETERGGSLDKNGATYYFGTASASRQDNTYGVFKWCLDKVQDSNSNYMTITYWKDQGEIYLSRIDYTVKQQHRIGPNQLCAVLS